MNRRFVLLLVLLATAFFGAADLSAQVMFGSLPPVDARAAIPYNHTVTATGGLAPYSYSITAIVENGSWLTVGGATGVLSGTPPIALAGANCSVELTVVDSTAPTALTNSMVITFKINNTASLPWVDNFGVMDDLGEEYITRTNLTSGIEMAKDVTAFNGNPANAVLMVGNATNPANNPPASGIDNLANWSMPGTAINSNVAELILPVIAPGATQLNVTFDFLLRNESTTASVEHYTNMVMDWSTSLSGPWNLVAGPSANIQPTGMTGNFIYRPAMNPSPGMWTNESVTFNPPGSQQIVYFRFRSCVRFATSPTGIPTWVAIDNLQVNWPLAITNNATLPNAPATTPYSTPLTTVGGIQPVISWSVPTYNWPALDPMNPLATLGLEITNVSGQWLLRCIPPTTIPMALIGHANNPFVFELLATDAGSGSLQSTVMKAFTLEVTPAPNPPAIVNNIRLSSAGFGSSYEHYMTLNGGVPPMTWTMQGAPSWLSIDPTLGKLSGTVPATGTPGTIERPRIRVTDYNGDFDDRQFEIELVDQLVFINTSSPNMYSFTALETRTERFQIQVEGGSAPYNFAFASGNKPDGLDVDPIRGIIFGAPYIGSASALPQGIYLFQVSVSDTGSLNSLIDVRIDVLGSPATGLNITTQNNLIDAEERVFYEVAFDAIGGTPPYTWLAVPGTVPPGMTLSSAGFLSGIPDDGSANTYTMQISVTDSAATPVVDNMNFTLDVTQDAFPPNIVTTTLPNAEVGKFYSSTVILQDGVAPFLWTIQNAPSWLSITPAGAAASISGRPTKDDTGGTITITVTDSNPLGAGSDSVMLTFSVDPFTGQLVAVDESQFFDFAYEIPGTPPTSVIKKSISAAKEDETYNYVLPVIGGVGPYKWSITQGALPGGLFLQATGSIVGKPSVSTASTRLVTFRVVDAAGYADTSEVIVRVLPKDATGGIVDPVNLDLGPGGGCSLKNAPFEWFALLALCLASVIAIRRRRVSN